MVSYGYFHHRHHHHQHLTACPLPKHPTKTPAKVMPLLDVHPTWKRVTSLQSRLISPPYMAGLSTLVVDWLPSSLPIAMLQLGPQLLTYWKLPAQKWDVYPSFAYMESYRVIQYHTYVIMCTIYGCVSCSPVRISRKLRFMVVYISSRVIYKFFIQSLLLIYLVLPTSKREF
jgi:hypothetical protein